MNKILSSPPAAQRGEFFSHCGEKATIARR